MNIDFKESHLGDNTTCVIAFASGADKFEWGRTLAAIPISHVLMRDTTERWYNCGVQGIGRMDDVGHYIRLLKRRYQRVIMLGLSSGSYAAMLYGINSRCKVIAISPTTGKGTPSVRRDFAPEWWDRLTLPPDHPPVADLIVFARERGLPIIKAFVSDGEGTELDRKMAERIGISDITLVPGYSHSTLAAGLRDRGIIAELLR